MPFTLKALQEREGELLDECEAIVDRAERENRELTDAERRRVKVIMSEEIPAVQADIELAAQIEDEKLRLAGERVSARLDGPGRGNQQPMHLPEWHAAYAGGNGRQNGNGQPAPLYFETKEGERLRAYRPGESMLADVPQNDRLSLAKGIVALVTGRRAGAEREVAALAGGSNEGGGYLVPEQMMPGLIDLARDQVAATRNAMFVNLTGDSAVFAKLVGDPEFQPTAEKQKLPDTDLKFSRLTMVPIKHGCLIEGSRELFEDAPNIEDIVRQSLVNAMAVYFDRVALYGIETEPTSNTPGLFGAAGVQEMDNVGPVGSAGWESIIRAVTKVEEKNHRPNAWLVSPKRKGEFSLLTSGDGVDSAKLWLPAPPDVQALDRRVSNICRNSEIFVGDFSKMVVGIRDGSRVEFSATAGDAFERHLVYVKLTIRFDVAFTHPEAFVKLTGVTDD